MDSGGKMISIFKRKPKEVITPIGHQPITHYIRIAKNEAGFYVVNILDLDRSDIINREYDSEKEARLSMVELRNAMQNGTYKVEVEEDKE
jgi:serine/threonine protein kinase HipA of HipAB toxin-antitoxin module